MGVQNEGPGVRFYWDFGTVHVSMIFHRTCFKTKIHGSLSSAITGRDRQLLEKNLRKVGDLCLAVQGGQSDDVGSEPAFKLAGTLKVEIKQQEQPPTG